MLRLDGAVAFAWIVDTPLEDVVGRGTLVLPGNGSMGIGGPVDNRDNLVRRVGRDGSLIPVVLHLNLKLPNQVEVDGITIRDLDVGQTSLDRVDGLGDVVDKLYGDTGLAANKVAVHVGGHAIDILVILGEDVLDHVALGSGGNHELEERVTRVLQLMVLGEELVRKVGERASRLEYMLKGTKDGIAIVCEPFHNSLFAVELALVVCIASIKLVDQL